MATATPSASPTVTVTDTVTATPVETPTSTPSPTTDTVAPTSTPTATPLQGPLVTAIGIADGSGAFNLPVETDSLGRAVYLRTTATGFSFYVEGRPGPSGLPVAGNLFNSRPNDPSRRPDLQVVSSRPLGDGSVAVCDRSFPNGGGVPAVDTIDFESVQATSDAMNDLACRFKSYPEADFACTQDSTGNLLYANPASTMQFCLLADDNIAFPIGDTVLAVRLRDTAGNVGEARQVVVRIVGSGGS